MAERGTGRFVNKEQHDNAYTGMVESVRALERDKLTDAVRQKVDEDSQQIGVRIIDVGLKRVDFAPEVQVAKKYINGSNKSVKKFNKQCFDFL